MVYGSYTMEGKQVYLEPGQEYELKRLAKRRGISVSSLIREAVDQYLAAHEPRASEQAEDYPLWKIIGIAGKEAGPPLQADGSVNHDRDLYGSPRP